MFKYVVLAALLVSAFAETKMFQPKIEGCAYHEKDGEYDNYVMLTVKDGKIEGYLFMTNTTPDYGKDYASKEYIRCDKRNKDGNCMYITHWSDGNCTTEWTDGSEYYLDMNFQLNWLNEPFYYDTKTDNKVCPNTPAPAPSSSAAPTSSSAAPVPPTSSSAAPVPPTSSDAPSSSSAAPEPEPTPARDMLLRDEIPSYHCSEYCNSTTKKCIIADDQNRIVQTELQGEVIIVHYYDDQFTTEIFKTTDCDGNALDAPVDVCKSGASTVFVSAVVLALVALVALF